MTDLLETFSAKLAYEMAALDANTRAELIINVGRMETKMRQNGQETPIWRGPLSEGKLLGANVIVPTEFGDLRGRVVCFGIVRDGAEFERSVYVHVPASGTSHEVPGSSVKLATFEDVNKMNNEIDMANKLKELTASEETSTEKPSKKKAVKDPAFVKRLFDEIGKFQVAVEEGTSNYKISGKDKKRIYLFKTQLRCDLSGFSIDHSAVRKISEAEAKDSHLGNVRGQLIFDDREAAFSAFIASLAAIC